MVAVAPRMIHNLGPLLLSTTEDTLTLILGTLDVSLQIDNGRWLTPDLTASISSALLEIWVKNARGRSLPLIYVRCSHLAQTRQIQSYSPL